MCGGRRGRHSSRTAASDGLDRLGEDWNLRFPPKRSALQPSQDRERGGGPRTLDAKPAQLRGSENSPSLVTSACFHVPPVVLPFEPASNGGPRTDFPPEECVLLLIHRTARSFQPSGTRGKDGQQGRPGPAALRACPVRVRRGGSLRCFPGQRGQSGDSKSKRDSQRSRLNSFSKHWRLFFCRCRCR